MLTDMLWMVVERKSSIVLFVYVMTSTRRTMVAGRTLERNDSAVPGRLGGFAGPCFLEITSHMGLHLRIRIFTLKVDLQGARQ